MDSRPISERFISTGAVQVHWIWDDQDGYIYDSEPESLRNNPASGTIRFVLRERNGDDDKFEILIKQEGDEFFARIDYESLDDREHKLKLYVGNEDLVLYLETVHNRVYFHLSDKLLP